MRVELRGHLLLRVVHGRPPPRGRRPSRAAGMDLHGDGHAAAAGAARAGGGLGGRAAGRLAMSPRRRSFGLPEVLDEAAETVAAVAAPFLGLLWLTSLPL